MRFIGDCHGKIDQLKHLCDRHQDTSLFQLGDMGLGFSGVILPVLPEFKFIRGNHDSPSLCQAHPNYAGEFGYQGGLFWLGGAFSIDWQWRKPGISWWYDEQLSSEQLAEALELYKASKPEVVATHEAPTKIGALLLHKSGLRPEKGGCLTTRTATMLQDMFEAHAPKQWFFGHYHLPFHEEVNGTVFTCLPELQLSEEVSL